MPRGGADARKLAELTELSAATGISLIATNDALYATPEVRALLLAGLLGGFTTFSSYMNESVVLVREGQFVWAGLNLGGQVVAGFVAFWLAFTAASWR